MQHIVDELRNGKLPKYRFFQFELSQTEIKRYLVSNPVEPEEFEDLVAALQRFDKQLADFRTFLQNEFGFWATITESLMDEWVRLFPEENYLELMAGNGYISRGMRDRQVQSFCTDDLSWSTESQTGRELMTDVESLDAISALKKYAQQVSAVILAWSPDKNEIDFEILQMIRRLNVKFFVIGERYGATNSKKFWDNIQIVDDDRIDELNKAYPNYDLVHDQVYLLK